MKSYTDLEQSKKLAEILPLESADIEYMFLKKDGSKVSNVPFVKDEFEEHECCYTFIPCWSLAALFGVLPTIDDKFEPQLHRSLDKYRCTYEGEEDSSGLWRVADNPIDACYDIILKLHELNIL